MDRDFLAILATSAPVECVYSQSNDRINKKRNGADINTFDGNLTTPLMSTRRLK
jgi:hypothetical protein